MEELQPVLAVAFKAIALALAAAGIILAVLRVGSYELYVILLSVGLFAVTLGTLIRPSSID